MKLSKAVVVSEGVIIKIGRFTWDLSNCRGNVPLISHQLYLLIPSGGDFYPTPGDAFIHFQREDHMIFRTAEN